MTSRIDERTTTGDRAEQTFKHRARDALGLADLRFNGLQHASMLRGVEVRGSEGIQERPARPRSSRGVGKRWMDEGLPGADQRIRAMSRVRSLTVEPVKAFASGELASSPSGEGKSPALFSLSLRPYIPRCRGNPAMAINGCRNKPIGPGGSTRRLHQCRSITRVPLSGTGPHREADHRAAPAGAK